jgi:hypothetical protein
MLKEASVNNEKRGSLTFIDPYNSTELSYRLVQKALSEVGIQSEDHEWLFKALLRSDCLGDASDTPQLRAEADHVFDGSTFLGPISDIPGRTGKLLILASMLAGFGPRYSPESGDGESAPDWLADFGRFGNLDAKDIAWDSIVQLSLREEFYTVLIPTVIPLAEIIQVEEIGTGSDSFDSECSTNIEFWLAKWYSNGRPYVSFDHLVEFLKSKPETQMAQGILDVIRRIESILGPQQFGPAWQIFREEVCKLHKIVNEKAPENSRNDLLERVWWQTSALIYTNTYGGIEPDESLVKRLTSSAKLHLGKMRSELKDNPDDCDFDHYTWAVSILKSFTSPWQAVRSLLLVLAEMNTPSVLSDLRYWNAPAPEPCPPERFSLVPTWIATSLYSEALKNEIAVDTTLMGFRREFCKYCLSRLRTRKSETRPSSRMSNLKNEDFVEPRPLWRFGYVKAMQELGVDTANKAYKTLRWLSQNDPDEDIQRVAKSAYHAIRSNGERDATPKPGVSPRRPLFAAFWWLRQAHLLNLGFSVDPDGANRTRDTEIRRTREA